MIVMTGLGTVGASGLGRAALGDALAAGESVGSAVDQSAGYHRPGSARLAALVNQSEVDKRISPAAARRMSAPSRLAVVAAAEALQDAGLSVPEDPDPDIAVIAATSLGPSGFTQQMLDQIMGKGPKTASPMLFSECVANAPAARMSIACRAAGLNFTLAQGEAGPLRAVARGAREVAAGRARVVLAGAVDEVTPLVHAILDRFRALARPGTERPERARPFDRARDGFLAAEGATFVVLEDEQAANARGAQTMARVRGCWSAFDYTAPASGWGSGVELLARRLLSGLESCGLSPARIGLIVSGASGSVAGDRLEALVLRAAWGDCPLPPVITPKATIGEYSGAFLGAASLVTHGSPWQASNPTDVDPEIEMHPRAHWHDRPNGAVLVTSLAAGGSTSWLALEHP